MKCKSGKFTVSSRTCIEGHHLPQGCIYGKDKKSMWYCRDYRIVNMYQVAKSALKRNDRGVLAHLATQLGIPVLKADSDYQLMIKIRNAVQTKPHKKMCRTENGWEEVVVTPAHLKVVALRIRRPIVVGNHTKWITRIECGPHVDHILEMIEEHPEKAVIVPQGTAVEYKQTLVMRNGMLRKKCVPVVSNRDAKSVSQNPDGRQVKEFHQDFHMRGPTKHQPKEYSIATGAYYSLEKGNSAKYEELKKQVLQQK